MGVIRVATIVPSHRSPSAEGECRCPYRLVPLRTRHSITRRESRGDRPLIHDLLVGPAKLEKGFRAHHSPEDQGEMKVTGLILTEENLWNASIPRERSSRAMSWERGWSISTGQKALTSATSWGSMDEVGRERQHP